MSRRQQTDTVRADVPVISAMTRRAGELTAELGMRVSVADVLSVAAERGLASVTADDMRRRRSPRGDKAA